MSKYTNIFIERRGKDFWLIFGQRPVYSNGRTPKPELIRVFEGSEEEAEEIRKEIEK